MQATPVNTTENTERIENPEPVPATRRPVAVTWNRNLKVFQKRYSTGERYYYWNPYPELNKEGQLGPPRWWVLQDHERARELFVRGVPNYRELWPETRTPEPESEDTSSPVEPLRSSASDRTEQPTRNEPGPSTRLDPWTGLLTAPFSAGTQNKTDSQGTEEPSSITAYSGVGTPPGQTPRTGRIRLPSTPQELGLTRTSPTHRYVEGLPQEEIESITARYRQTHISDVGTGPNEPEFILEPGFGHVDQQEQPQEHELEYEQPQNSDDPELEQPERSEQGSEQPQSGTPVTA